MSKHHPLGLVAYEVAMVVRAMKRARSHLGLELAIISGSALGSALVEAAVKGSADITTFWIALGGGFTGAISTLGYFVFQEPARAHNELIAEIHERDQHFRFAEILRARRRAIEAISTLSATDDDLEQAFFELGNQQRMTIDALWRSDNPWKHKPDGWGKKTDQDDVWISLAVVLDMRYPGEIISVPELYDVNIGDGFDHRRSNNFGLFKEHALEILGALIKEIEQPHLPFVAEKPDTFMHFMSLLKQPDPDTPDSQTSTAAPEHPEK